MIERKESIAISNYLLSYNLEHNNRIRKLFTLTDEGRNKIENFKKEFENIIRIYEYIKEE